jgi:predicted MFS family arabinose efflux permease
MDEATKKPPYRRVIAVLLLLLPFCQMIPYMAPAVIMPEIMTDLDVGYGLAGMTIMIMLVISGICVFVGSAVQDRIGTRSTFILAVWLLCTGNILSFLSPNIGILLVSRAIAGAGSGIYSSCISPFLSTWFEGKERTFMITANLITSSIGLAVSYSIAGPVIKLVGSWRAVFGVYGAGIFVVALLWTFFGKANPVTEAALEEQRKRAKQGAIKQQSSIIRAFKEKQFVLVMIIGIFATIVNAAVSSFLPTYLTTNRGFELTLATTIAGIMSIAGIIGALLGGFLSAQTGRRKPIMIISLVIYAAAVCMLSLFNSPAALITASSLVSIGFYLIYPSQSSLIIETPQPFDPTILGAAFAMTSGVGQIASLAASPLFSALSSALGMPAAFRVFAASLLVSLVICLCLRETGTRARKPPA